MENLDCGEKDFTFLGRSDSEQLFGKLDEEFRKSRSIQYPHSKQGEIWAYICKHEVVIRNYYKKIFNADLVTRGQDSRRYFYLDFNRDPGSRTSVKGFSHENRRAISHGTVLIGLLIWIIVIHDANIEVDNVESLLTIIRDEYSDCRDNLYKVVANIHSQVATDLDNQKIEKLIQIAIKDLDKLGWIDLNPETHTFEIMPSLDRLVFFYKKEIEEIRPSKSEDPQ